VAAIDKMRVGFEDTPQERIFWEITRKALTACWSLELDILLFPGARSEKEATISKQFYKCKSQLLMAFIGFSLRSQVDYLCLRYCPKASGMQ